MAWQIAPGLTPYPAALAAMEARVAAIRAGEAERVGLAGRASAALHGRHQRPRPQDLLEPGRFPVFAPDAAGESRITGRGSAWPI